MGKNDGQSRSPQNLEGATELQSGVEWGAHDEGRIIWGSHEKVTAEWQRRVITLDDSIARQLQCLMSGSKVPAHSISRFLHKRWINLGRAYINLPVVYFRCPSIASQSYSCSG